MATKRSRTSRLISRPSELSAQVTLFEVAKVEGDVEDVMEDTPRRSKRVRREVVKTEMCDLEDLISPSPSPPPTTSRKKRTTKLEEEDASSSSTSRRRGRASPVKKTVTKVKLETTSALTASKKRGRVSSKKPIPKALSTPHPAPENWEETYAAIKAMRARFVAPVDTMGCQMAQVAETDPKNRRYSTLVSLMLSSQTRDEVCYAAVNNLRAAFGGSISIDAMLAAENSVISEAIKIVGFWHKKTTYLKEAAIALRDNFNSDVPKTVDELCSLLGVGPKMSFLTLKMAWNINAGIGVDVHVHRITNLLGWHKPPTKTPEQTRLNLESWLPKELWGDINHMMVGFGQVICQPAGPRCDMCDLSTKGLCPSARVVKNRKPIVFIKPDQESPAKIEVALEEDIEEDVNGSITEEQEELSLKLE